MDTRDTEFETALELERIRQQTEWEARLGRPFERTEKIIFDSGFYSGARFGARDTMKATERIMRGVKA
jgi:hypothetical protein